MILRTLILTLVYCLFGMAGAVLADFATGVGPFGSNQFDQENLLQGAPVFGECLVPLVGRDLARVPDIALGFLFEHLPIALVLAFLLVLLGKKRFAWFWVFGVGLTVPVTYELVLSGPLAHSWVGMALAILCSWPNVPEYVMPPGEVVRVAVAYLLPALFAGLGASLLTVYSAHRQLAKEGQ